MDTCGENVRPRHISAYLAGITWPNKVAQREIKTFQSYALL